MIVFLCLLLSSIWLFYYFWTANYKYWKKQGVPSLPPSFPFGNEDLKETVLFRRYQGFVYKDVYDKLAPHPYGGVYDLRRPVLVLRDPDIIKLVMVKEFPSFMDRFQFGREEKLAEHLLNLGGSRWKALRVKLTPIFTSGKLKSMFRLFNECSDRFDDLLRQKAATGEPADMKDLMARFTLDTIASCAFGVDAKAGSDNRLGRILALVVKPPSVLNTILGFAMNSIFPTSYKWLKFRIFPKDVDDIIYPMIKETVEFREKNNFKRGDMIDLLIDIKNMGTKEGEDEIEMDIPTMTAQCFIFLLAGYETSSSVQSYCLFELSQNQDIQDKLRTEILEVRKRHGGNTYEAIQEMHYLDQVVSETIRKYPTLPVIPRHCTKRFKMPDSDFVVEEGTKLVIPAYALHHDPALFPDPERFDPDRFSPQRKASIRPYSYLPFGEGPRICIGMRFGLLQTKVGLCTVLSKYKILPAKETTKPLNFICSTLVSCTAGPIELLIKQGL